MVISVANQKGGVGKTTTSQALACILGEQYPGQVLLIDFDPQANTTFANGIETTTIYTIYNALVKECKIEDIIHTVKYYDLIPVDESLTIADLKFKATEMYHLADIIKPIRQKYEYIIIDTPPALGFITLNALAASDYIIIPANLDAYSLQGFSRFANTVYTVKKYNHNLEILGILLTKYHNNFNEHKDMKETMELFAKSIGTRIFKTTISEGVIIGASQNNQVPIIDYKGKNRKPIEEYRSFVKELLKVLNRNR